MYLFSQKTKQKQILQQNHYQTTKNNFEAIILSFNRVLYLIGFKDFLAKHQLSIQGQNFQSLPFDLEVEFDILLYTMLNLKVIPGLSECDQLHELEQQIYKLYSALNQQFVSEIFQLSKLSIKGDPNAKKQYLHLKQQYPSNFLLSSQALNSQQKNREVNVPETKQIFSQDIEQEHALESVQQFAHHQQLANQLLDDLRTGKINEREYNSNLYKLGFLDQNEYEKQIKQMNKSQNANEFQRNKKQDKNNQMEIEQNHQIQQNDKQDQAIIEKMELELQNLKEQQKMNKITKYDYEYKFQYLQYKYKKYIK